jgi:hypothetical protein
LNGRERKVVKYDIGLPSAQILIIYFHQIDDFSEKFRFYFSSTVNKFAQ